MRSVNGLLLLDKPSGISSAACLNKLKTLFQIKKIGHTGTLDPLATGMLPVCFGEATKFSQYLFRADKSYKVLVRLGERTHTADSSGDIISVRPVRCYNDLYFRKVLDNFVGQRYQVPSMFSALKYKGCPLYKYARVGINIPRTPRLINIYKINILHVNDNSNIELEIFCSKGTYIRTLIDDLGEYIGCGAHVLLLRRLSVGEFTSSNMVDFSFLYKYVNDCDCVDYFKKLDSLLKPIDMMMHHLPEINVSFKICRLLQFGQKIFLNTIMCSDISYVGLVRMTVGKERKFFGIGNIIDNMYLLAHRLISFK